MERGHLRRDPCGQAFYIHGDVTLKRLLLPLPSLYPSSRSSFGRFANSALRNGGLPVTTFRGPVNLVPNATTDVLADAAFYPCMTLRLASASAKPSNKTRISLHPDPDSTYINFGEGGIGREGRTTVQSSRELVPHNWSSFQYSSESTPYFSFGPATSHLFQSCGDNSHEAYIGRNRSSHEERLALASFPPRYSHTVDAWRTKPRTVLEDVCPLTNDILSDGISGYNADRQGKSDGKDDEAIYGTKKPTTNRHHHDTVPPPTKKMCLLNRYANSTSPYPPSFLSSSSSSSLKSRSFLSSSPSSPGGALLETFRPSFMDVLPHLATTQVTTANAIIQTTKDVALPLPPRPSMRKSSFSSDNFQCPVPLPQMTSELARKEDKGRTCFIQRQLQARELEHRQSGTEEDDIGKGAILAPCAKNLNSSFFSRAFATNGRQTRDEEKSGISSCDDLRKNGHVIFNSNSETDEKATKKRDSASDKDEDGIKISKSACSKAASISFHEAKETSINTLCQNEEKTTIGHGYENSNEKIEKITNSHACAKKKDKQDDAVTAPSTHGNIPSPSSAPATEKRQSLVAVELPVSSCVKPEESNIVNFKSHAKKTKEEAMMKEDDAMEDTNNKMGADHPAAQLFTYCETTIAPMDALGHRKEHSTSKQDYKKANEGRVPISHAETMTSLPETSEKCSNYDDGDDDEKASSNKWRNEDTLFFPDATASWDAASKDFPPTFVPTPNAVLPADSANFRQQQERKTDEQKKKNKNKNKRTSEFAGPIRRQRSRRWDDMVDQLRRYRLKHGHCIVPRGHEHYKLALWVSEQRKQYRLLSFGKPSNITAERIKLLNGLGFVWNAQEAAWERHFADLVEFKRRHGHAVVPQKSVEFPQLGMWVKEQRRSYGLLKDKSSTKITEEHLQALRSVGFIFNCLEASWWETYRELEEFQRTNGHCLVPSKYSPNKKLGTWVRRQRLLYKQRNKGDTGAMAEARIKALEKLGFTWVLERLSRP